MVCFATKLFSDIYLPYFEETVRIVCLSLLFFGIGAFSHALFWEHLYSKRETMTDSRIATNT